MSPGRVARDRAPGPDGARPDNADLFCPGLGGLNRGPAGGSWWVLFDADCSELRAAGFSPGGSTLTVATSSDVTLWTRNP